MLTHWSYVSFALTHWRHLFDFFSQHVGSFFSLEISSTGLFVWGCFADVFGSLFAKYVGERLSCLRKQTCGTLPHDLLNVCWRCICRQADFFFSSFHFVVHISYTFYIHLMYYVWLCPASSRNLLDFNVACKRRCIKIAVDVFLIHKNVFKK